MKVQLVRERSHESTSTSVDLVMSGKAVECSLMSSEADSNQTELKELFLGKVPPLTAEQINVALQVWQKIKTRRERVQK